ncbi:peroxiredoxin [Salininema proteolyticum]|uniref:thioredoxin-dependent peroxiredoxin n=1 Tax=Salininema proteolyticum TaxID=1607685 RepID=A0ABV8U3V4_9ACTN
MGIVGPGTLVEDFSLPDQSGGVRSLSEFLAEGPVVLFFYPRAMTSGCTAESCHFRDLAGEFAEAGARVVGVSADPPARQREFDEAYSLGYPLLSDVDHVVAEALGVRRWVKLGPLSRKRVTFVIGSDWRIGRVVHSETSMREHADEALAFVRGTHGG